MFTTCVLTAKEGELTQMETTLIVSITFKEVQTRTLSDQNVTDNVISGLRIHVHVYTRVDWVIGL